MKRYPLRCFSCRPPHPGDKGQKPVTTETKVQGFIRTLMIPGKDYSPIKIKKVEIDPKV